MPIASGTIGNRQCGACKARETAVVRAAAGSMIGGVLANERGKRGAPDGRKRIPMPENFDRDPHRRAMTHRDGVTTGPN